jgi:hypothetical protein
MIVQRKENGKLGFNEMDCSIFLSELFSQCSTEREVFWLANELSGMVGICADNMIDVFRGKEEEFEEDE